MPTMFRKRKDANEETMAMGRVVGVRNASPAHRVAQLQEREGASERIALTMQKSFRGMKGRAAKWYWEESAAPRGNHLYAIDATGQRAVVHSLTATQVRSECTNTTTSRKARAGCPSTRPPRRSSRMRVPVHKSNFAALRFTGD